MSRGLSSVVPTILLAVLGAVGARAADPIRLEPSTIRVGIARVTLVASDLVLDGDRLRGTYAIEIPLAPMMNDRGTLLLPLGGSLERLLERGGRIVGSGSSSEDGRTHRILCDFRPGGEVDITVESSSRRLEFPSRLRRASGRPAGLPPRGR